MSAFAADVLGGVLGLGPDVLRRAFRLRADVLRGGGALPADVLDAIDAGAGEAGDAHREVFWTLDPIDGTKGFLRGEQYAISLAWIRGGAPVLGLLGCPNLSADFGRPFDDPDLRGCIYMAEAGSGLYELPADTPDARPLKIQRLEREEGEPVRVCESVESAHSSQSDTARVLERLGLPSEVMRLDSQAKYAVVARGQADAYMRMPTRKGYVERIWDHAAGAIIATEGSCAVSDVRGASLDFGHGRGLDANVGIVCAPPALHGRLVGAVQELGLDAPPA